MRVRDEIAVREHRALRDAGRAAGVLQRGDAVVIERLARRASRSAPAAMRSAPCASARRHRRVRERDRRHHLLHVFLHAR